MVSQQLVTAPWRRFHGNAGQRVVALPAIAVLLAGLTWAWWPDGGTYRPVQPHERVTLSDPTTSMSPQSGAVFPQSGALLRKAASPVEPALRIAPVGWDRRAPDWVFPFDEPDAPEEDDNQALAVNTTDGSETYSVEFALVWAEDGEPVDTRNEAYALASCTGCAAVAVGFQVVLMEEQAEVIAPENHSAAVNYECTECLTHALATQLVVTVDDSQCTAWMDRLSALWDEIDEYSMSLEYGGNLQNIPLSEIQTRLEAYQEQIIAIVQPGRSATSAGDPPPSSDPTVEEPVPTADTGGTGPAAEPQPSTTSI